MTETSADETARPTHAGLFTAFLKIGLLGFGGVAAWARHVLVVERRFLDARDFAESFGIASSLPGANTVNLATILGDRFCGPLGAVLAVLGLMGAPILVLTVIAMAYAQFGALADVEAGLFGAAAAAAGVVLGTSVKILLDLEPDVVALLTVASVCFATMGKISMLTILVLAVPLSIGARLLRSRSA